jgi:hypothetical protein
MDLVLGALGYPFQKENRGYLVWGAILFTVPPLVYSLLPGLPYVGLIGTLVEAGIFAYMILFFQSVLETATRGDERLEWPDLSDAHTLATEVFRIAIPVIISFLPVIALFVYWTISGAFRDRESHPVTALRILSLSGGMVAGAAYLPMALLAYSFYGETAVVKVWAIVPAIARVWSDYWKVVLLLVGLFLVHGSLAALAFRWPLPIAVPIAALLFYYTMVAGVRAIGLLYRRNRDRLGWERARS